MNAFNKEDLRYGCLNLKVNTECKVHAAFLRSFNILTKESGISSNKLQLLCLQRCNNYYNICVIGMPSL
jgi:hypothetical protein